MLVIEQIEDMREVSRHWHKENETVGLVPTMGALHAGHLSLVQAAAEQNQRVVVSIFVNPAQFAPGEDFAAYPRDPGQDIAQLEGNGVDVVFMPKAETLYHPGYQTWVEVAQLGQQWIGAYRPGFFRGVATVLTKLFNIIEPSRAYFGQKDFQQTVLVKQLVRDLNFPLQVQVMPTLREPDGLAMSSRNLRLGPEQRARVPVIHQALRQMAARFAAGEKVAELLQSTAREVLEQSLPEAEIKTLAIVDPGTLEAQATARIGDVCLLEVMVGDVLLYDNVTFGR